MKDAILGLIVGAGCFIFAGVNIAAFLVTPDGSILAHGLSLGAAGFYAAAGIYCLTVSLGAGRGK